MRFCCLAALAVITCLVSGSVSWGQTNTAYRSDSVWSARSATYSTYSHLWQGHHGAGCGCDKAPVWETHCGPEPACCCKPCLPRVIPFVLNGIGNTLDKILLCNKCCQPTCCDKPVKTCCTPSKPCCSKPAHVWSGSHCDCDHHAPRATPDRITPPSPFLDEEVPPAPPKDARGTYPAWNSPSASRMVPSPSKASNQPTPARVTEPASHNNKTAAASAAPQRLEVHDNVGKLYTQQEPAKPPVSVIRRTSADDEAGSTGMRTNPPVNPLRK